MDKWNEVRTAYKLAKLGTLSATAEDIGVHRSTVMRHIDTLEEYLGVTLFQRNDKGYIPTEAGLDIMRLGEVTDNHFSQLPTRLKSKEQALTGKLTITIVSELAAAIMPVVYEYQQQHPAMAVEIIGDLRNFNLQYGEADIAIRAGDKPTTPDNVVLPLFETELVLMAHQNYLQRHGMPEQGNFSGHRFVALNQRPPHLRWNEWIYQNIAADNIVVSGSAQQIVTQAIMTACGIGALPRQMLNNNRQLKEIPFDSQWQIAAWILVHRDMMAMPKVKKFIEILQQHKQQHSISFSLM